VDQEAPMNPGCEGGPLVFTNGTMGGGGPKAEKGGGSRERRKKCSKTNSRIRNEFDLRFI